MQTIPLSAIPNQELTVTLDSVLYDLRVIETNGCMSMDITRAGVVVVQGQRLVAGQPVLMLADQGVFGNFTFLTADDALPYYDQFGLTQTLVFATTAEINALAAA